MYIPLHPSTLPLTASSTNGRQPQDTSGPHQAALSTLMERTETIFAARSQQTYVSKTFTGKKKKARMKDFLLQPVWRAVMKLPTQVLGQLTARDVMHTNLATPRGNSFVTACLPHIRVTGLGVR